MSFSFYLIGTWSGLYFGIKYYQMVQRQNERLLKATSAAHRAQLKMLRYQLNPHFLFNTLNSIYALVRLGNNDRAEDMIQQLSRFLRHSLDQGDEVVVTLEQELESLQLYLDIEQARFEDRLDVIFDNVGTT